MHIVLTKLIQFGLRPPLTNLLFFPPPLSLPDKHPQLNEFLTQIKNTPDLANLFESIQKDTSSGGGGPGGLNFNFGDASMDTS